MTAIQSSEENIVGLSFLLWSSAQCASLENGALWVAISPVLLHRDRPEQWIKKKCWKNDEKRPGASPAYRLSLDQLHLKLQLQYIFDNVEKNHLLQGGALDLHLVRLQDGDSLARAAAHHNLRHNSILKIIFCTQVWNAENLTRGWVWLICNGFRFGLIPAHPCSWQSPCPPPPRSARCGWPWQQLVRCPFFSKSIKLLLLWDFSSRMSGFLQL